MRLTAKSEYGLLAMIDLASQTDGTPVSARTLAERRDIPQPYLEQLFAALRREGLVTAVRGAYGGFVLARPATQTTVLDVVEALEGPLSSGVCEAEKSQGCTSASCCAAAPVWAKATEALRDVFASMYLSDLASHQAIMDSVSAQGKKDN